MSYVWITLRNNGRNGTRYIRPCRAAHVSVQNGSRASTSHEYVATNQILYIPSWGKRPVCPSVNYIRFIASCLELRQSRDRARSLIMTVISVETTKERERNEYENRRRIQEGDDSRVHVILTYCSRASRIPSPGQRPDFNLSPRGVARFSFLFPIPRSAASYAFK